MVTRRWEMAFQDCLGTLSALEVAQVPPQRFWVVGQWIQRRPWGLHSKSEGGWYPACNKLVVAALEKLTRKEKSKREGKKS